MTLSIRCATTLAALAIGLAVATSYSQAAVQTENLTFTAALSPANEVPAITNAESKGSGEVTIVLHLTRDASKSITAATADFKGSLKGFAPETAITAAHIHRGATGTNGGVAVNPMFKAGEIALSGGAGTVFQDGRDRDASRGPGDPQRTGDVLLQRPQFTEHGRSRARPAHGGQVTARRTAGMCRLRMPAEHRPTVVLLTTVIHAVVARTRCIPRLPNWTAGSRPGLSSRRHSETSGPVGRYRAASWDPSRNTGPCSVCQSNFPQLGYAASIPCFAEGRFPAAFLGTALATCSGAP